MSGGSSGPYDGHDGADPGYGEDITLADVCATLGQLHGLVCALSCRVQAAEEQAARAELRADVAVTMALGEVPEPPADEPDQEGPVP
jgi:hypothetical protein